MQKYLHVKVRLKYAANTSIKISVNKVSFLTCLIINTVENDINQLYLETVYDGRTENIKQLTISPNGLNFRLMS